MLTLSSREPDAHRACTWFAGVPEAVVTQRVARQSLCHLARGLAPSGVVPDLVLGASSR